MRKNFALVAATGVVLLLGACESAPPAPAQTGVAPAAGAPAQQGYGYDPQDRYVTQRGGTSAGMQGGQITGIQQEGGGNVSIQRRGTGTGTRNPRIDRTASGVSGGGLGDANIVRQGVGAPAPGQAARPTQPTQ